MFYGEIFLKNISLKSISAGGVLVMQHPKAEAANHCQVHRTRPEKVSGLIFIFILVYFSAHNMCSEERHRKK